MATTTLSRAEVATALGVGPKRISALVAKGRLTRSAGARFTLGDLATYNATKAAGPVATAATLGLARARAERAERQTADVLAAQLPAAEVTAAWSGTAANIAARLRQLPAALAQALAAESYPIPCETIMRDGIYAALTELGAAGDAAQAALVAEDAVLAPSEPRTLAAYRARAADAQAALIDAGERLKAGTDRLVADVMTEGYSRAGNCRQALLAIPTKFAAIVAVQRDATKIERMITEEIEAAILELDA